MNIFIDIETIPDQRPGALDKFIDAADENFKAPSGMTKKQACAELGVDDQASEWKYKTKDECLAAWCEEFKATKLTEVAELEWRKTSFDGGQGQVFSVAWGGDEGSIDSVCAYLDDEFAALSQFNEMLEEQLHINQHVANPFWIGQNVANFDLKFLFKRFVILGIKPKFKLHHVGRHGTDFFDTQIAWAGYKDRCSLDKMCRDLQIEGKPDDIDGSKVWDHVRDGHYDRVIEYNKDDVEKVRTIYKRLNFL